MYDGYEEVHLERLSTTSSLKIIESCAFLRSYQQVFIIIMFSLQPTLFQS